MIAAGWWLVGALAVARAVYPRMLERRQSGRLVMGGDGVIVGAGPIDLARPGAPGVLVLHGGGDTPQSVRELADHLFAGGYSVRAPLLADHGRSLKHFRGFDAAKWRDQVRSEFHAMRAHHPWVAVVGQSVGGGLALDLAATNADVRALVLLTPWVAMPKRLAFLARTSSAWGPLFPYLPSLGGRSIHDPGVRSQALTRGIVTPQGLRAFAAVALNADQALTGVRIPTLMIQSSEDERVSRADAQRAFDRLGATDKKLEWTSGAGHVVSVDYGKERVFALTAEWLDTHRA